MCSQTCCENQESNNKKHVVRTVFIIRVSVFYLYITLGLGVLHGLMIRIFDPNSMVKRSSNLDDRISINSRRVVLFYENIL